MTASEVFEEMYTKVMNDTMTNEDAKAFKDAMTDEGIAEVRAKVPDYQRKGEVMSLVFFVWGMEQKFGAPRSPTQKILDTYEKLKARDKADREFMAPILRKGSKELN